MKNLLTPPQWFPIMKLQGAPRNWKPLPDATGDFGNTCSIRVIDLKKPGLPNVTASSPPGRSYRQMVSGEHSFPEKREEKTKRGSLGSGE